MVAKLIKKQITMSVQDRERKIFNILSTAIILLLICYVFLLTSAFFNAFHKQGIEKNSLSLVSEVNSMESEYLKDEESINMDVALSKGFVATNKQFVSISSSNTNLSLNVNGQ